MADRKDVDHGMCAAAWAYRWGCDMPRGHDGPHHFVAWMTEDPAPAEMNFASREHQDTILLGRDQ
jgi:hypothetical protein